MLSIKPIKAFSDNYIWLISTNEGSIVVDPGEADQVLKLMSSNTINLKAIFITHHHYDHTNGIDEILFMLLSINFVFLIVCPYSLPIDIGSHKI